MKPTSGGFSFFSYWGGVLCALQMCCNVRWVVRDFALNVLLLEGERNFNLGLRTTQKYTKVLTLSNFRIFF